LCVLRPCDVERPGLVVDGTAIWVCRLDRHKNDWRGQPRAFVVPVPAQGALAKYLEGRPPDAYCFSPRESWEASLAARRKPGTRPRRKARPKRTPGERYTSHCYARVVRKACVRAGVEPWHPHQLRHAAGDLAFTLDGVDGSMAFLGHDSAQANAVYRQKLERAARLAARLA
jgi:integrase